MKRCFVIHAADNVATLLDDALAAERVQVIGCSSDVGELAANVDINLGHKIALKSIRPGEPILKFGVTIGHATMGIAAGDWVHLHNLGSAFDERSGTFDLHSGATTDTKYE